MNRTQLWWVYVCIGLGALLPAAWAQGERTGAAVAVSATGTAYGVPDRASFDAGVSVLDKDVSRATARVSERVSSLLAALTAAGVAETDVRTVSFNVFPEQLYEGGQPTGVRYRVVNTVRVTARDAAQLGSLLGESVAAGANEVANVVYAVADPDALEQQARVQAMRAARAKAEQLARLGGAELGEVQRIAEQIGANGGVPVDMVRMESMAADAAISVPVAGGQLEVTVSVSVIYELR